MKYYLVFAPLFLCTLLSGQQNGVRLTLKGFVNYDRDEVTIDTSVWSTPLMTTGGETSFYNISISYLRETSEFTIIGGLGLNWSKDLLLADRKDLIFSRQDKIYRNQKEIEVHCGILKTVFTVYKKLEFNVGAGIAFESRIGKTNISNIDVFDVNEDYNNGRELKVDYSNLWAIGPTIELSTYYKLTKNIFLGVNFTSWFYFQKESGTEVYSYTFYGLGRVITGENKIERIINKKLFSKNGVFSYSILFKF